MVTAVEGAGAADGQAWLNCWPSCLLIATFRGLAASCTGRTSVSTRWSPELAGGSGTRYTIDPDSPFRHRAQKGLRVGLFLDALTVMSDAGTPSPPADTRGENAPPSPAPPGPAGSAVPGTWG
jgi:hypothetical protein